MNSYQNWDANLLVVLVTFMAVGLSVLVHYEGLSFVSQKLGRRHESQSRRNVLYVIYAVLALHISEIWIFGSAIWLLMLYPATGSVAGAHPLQLLDAVYLSAMTYTTVGFGDVAPVGPIRFLAGTTSLTGFVLITWSASFTFLEMEQFWRK
jgi:Ion channel